MSSLLVYTQNATTAPLSLEANAESTLFAACAEHGILLPSACGGRGLCGKCRTRILSGAHAQPTAPEQRLISSADFAQGWRLACQTKIGSGLSIELSPEILAVRRHLGRLEKKQRLTADIVLLTIRLEEKNPFTFRAGQYVQLESPAAKPPWNQPTLRAYSLSSLPSRAPMIQLMIRRVPNGLSSTWVHDKLQPGDTVALRGPFGNFHISSSPAPILAIAGSSGMSPFRSIFPQMVADGITSRPARFFFGAQTQADLFLLDEWAAFARQNPWFSFIPVLSAEPENSPWHGERGQVTDAVARHCPDLSTTEAYLCGSPGMIHAALALLAARGLPESRTFYDKFTS